nr:hypothetical protein CFP56_19225 [Quercus suber]
MAGAKFGTIGHGGPLLDIEGTWKIGKVLMSMLVIDRRTAVETDLHISMVDHDHTFDSPPTIEVLSQSQLIQCTMSRASTKLQGPLVKCLVAAHGHSFGRILRPGYLQCPEQRPEAQS